MGEDGSDMKTFNYLRHFNPRRWPGYLSLLDARRRKFIRSRREMRSEKKVRSGDPTALVKIEGFRLLVDLRDKGIGRPIYFGRRYERAETSFVRRVLKEGMTFVDIGANIGYYTVLAATVVGPRGRVISIEPDPYNYGLLRRNININKLMNVTILNLAAGSSNTELPLYQSHEGNFGDHRLFDKISPPRASVRVPVRVLEEIAPLSELDILDLLKLDVQGYECHVLKGMRRILDRVPRLTILTEYWPLGMEAAGSDPREFLDYFRGKGLDVYHLADDGGERRIRWEEIDALIPDDPDKPDWRYVNLILRG
jgi:FkbM family methyltransferase